MRDVAEKYGYEPIRYLMISSHYRSPINYSTDIFGAGKKMLLTGFYNCREGLVFALEHAKDGGEAPEYLEKNTRRSLSAQWTTT